jgi:hypothetical protein
MLVAKAYELRKAWGNKLCNHPRLDELYFLGYSVGQACKTCGHDVGSRTRLQRVWGAMYVAWSRLWPKGK